MKHPALTGIATEVFARNPERRLALLQAVWPAAVGPSLARRSVVVALDRGILRVRVPDAAWRKVLFRMRGEILNRLRKAAGPAAPRTLGFMEGPVPEPPRPEAPAAGPIDVVAPSSVRAAADAIADDELRTRFIQAAARYLARFEARANPAPDDPTPRGSGH